MVPHDDGHDDDDDDDGGGAAAAVGHQHFAAQKRRRSSTSSYWADSWRAVESAAMRIPVAAETSSSISSRLGGSLRYSSRGVVATTSADHQSDDDDDNDDVAVWLPTEGTPLVEQPGGSGPKAVAAPPLMKWIWIALLCALAYALYNIFIKKGSADIHPVLGGVILQFVAALLGSALLAGLVAFPADDTKIHVERPGLVWSVGAGVWVGLAEITSFLVAGMGVPASQFIPINIGGSVAIGTVLGVFIY